MLGERRPEDARRWGAVWDPQEPLVTGPAGYSLTLWFVNTAMENDPLIDDFPIETSIYRY